MILRDAFYGVRRFGEFKRRIGITQAVLSSRLAHMTEHGLLRRDPIDDGAAREEYRLTARGRALFPVVVSLMQWGDQHLHEREGSPVVLFDIQTGEPVEPIAVRSGGEPIDLREVGFRPGEGAKPETIAEFDLMSTRARR